MVKKLYTGPIKVKTAKKAGFGGIVAPMDSDFQKSLRGKGKKKAFGIVGKPHSTIHKAIKSKKKGKKTWTGGFG